MTVKRFLKVTVENIIVHKRSNELILLIILIYFRKGENTYFIINSNIAVTNK